MKENQMRRSEKIAEAVLKAVLHSVEVRYHDTGSGDSLHDFEIIKGTDVFAAVEVTETTRGKQKALEAELKRNADETPAKQVEGTWLVFLDPGSTRLERRAAEIDSCLAKFEKRGVQHFIASDGVPDDVTVERKEAFDQAWKLRILCADRHSLRGARILVTSGAGEVFCSSQDYVNLRIAELARKDDNRRKLRASGCARRILFVVVDQSTDYPCWKQVANHGLKGTPPTLPPEITEVWVTARDRDGKFVVWRASGARWQRLGVLSLELSPDEKR